VDARDGLPGQSTAGDVQGVNHLKNIATLARSVPQVRMWIPTREAVTVRAVQKDLGGFPDNLTVRVSAPMIDGRPPKGFPPTSVVYTEGAPEGSFACPSREQANCCADCRQCWDPVEAVIAYRRH
jgi:hypothetical protein